MAADGDTPAGSGQTTKTKRRHRHGRRKLELMNLPVVEQRVEPEEVTAAGGVGFELIDEEVSDRIARRPAQWVHLRTVRLKCTASKPPNQVQVSSTATTDAPRS
jgi:hypothetical protein